MATAIYAPRINNNDDEVKVLALDVGVGDAVDAGQIVGQVETDKAVLDVCAPSAGYVLALLAAPEQLVSVGSVMLWLGEHRDEAVPQAATAALGAHTDSTVTAKARLLIAANDLHAEKIPPIDGRVTVAAVERYLASRDASQGQTAPAARARDAVPEIDGRPVELTREEKGMLATVAWHRDHAAPGYIEIEYDLAPWTDFAARFQQQNGLLMPPLLPLMAGQLVELAVATPRLNATIVGNRRHEYSAVNLGFTIQAGEALYLAVLRDAQRLDGSGFVNALGELLRRATAHQLREAEASGATIGFSSMARWKVSRHVPILAPRSALMIAHAAGPDGRGVLGATYDHRVLNGGQVVAVLRKLSIPQEQKV